MSKLQRTLSNETKDLLDQLAAENRLSMVKRKGLVDHLMKSPYVRNASGSKECPEPCGPRQRPFIKRPRSHLDSVASLRKKEAIVKSGAYERSNIAPPKGKEINDTTKEKFIYQMAYRCQPPEPNLDLDQLLKRRKAKKVELEVTRSSREAELTREIDERLEFLEEMQSLGHHYVRKYQTNIKAEIAEKAHQLEMLQLEESEKISAAKEAVASSEDLFRS